MSSQWPTAPLIRIIKGEEDCCDVSGAVAARASRNYYVLLTGDHAGREIASDLPTCDSITEWEEMTAVPTAALKQLRQVSQGAVMSRPMTEALCTVTACLPAEPSPLARVVEYARRDDRGGMSDVDSYVSLLLRSMPSDTERPDYMRLLRIAREAVEHLRWREFVDPWGEIAGEAETLPLPETEDSRFTYLVKRIGAYLVHRDSDAATEIGATALAWAAQIIKEETK